MEVTTRERARNSKREQKKGEFPLFTQIHRSKKMKELIVKLIRWQVQKFLPEYHLSKNPTKRRSK